MGNKILYKYLLTICIALLMAGCLPQRNIEVGTISLDETMDILIDGFVTLQEKARCAREREGYMPYGLSPTEATVVFDIGITKSAGNQTSVDISLPAIKEIGGLGYKAMSSVSDSRKNTFTIKFAKAKDPQTTLTKDLKESDLIEFLRVDLEKLSKTDLDYLANEGLLRLVIKGEQDTFTGILNTPFEPRPEIKRPEEMTKKDLIEELLEVSEKKLSIQGLTYLLNGGLTYILKRDACGTAEWETASFIYALRQVAAGINWTQAKKNLEDVNKAEERADRQLSEAVLDAVYNRIRKEGDTNEIKPDGTNREAASKILAGEYPTDEFSNWWGWGKDTSIFFQKK